MLKVGTGVRVFAAILTIATYQSAAADDSYATDQFTLAIDGAYSWDAISVVSLEEAQPNDELDYESPPGTLDDLDDFLPSSAEQICPDPSAMEQQFKRLDQIHIGNPDDGKTLPPDCSTNLFQTSRPATRRATSTTCFAWQPTNFFHYPLYFEDVPLERYGQRRLPIASPAISGLKFLGDIAALPYKMTCDCPHDCVTTLGHHRAGSCVPCMRHAFVFDAKSGLVEAGTIVGLALLLP